MKICNKCKIEKDLSLFRKDKTKKCGLYHTCKVCEKQYRETQKSNQKQYQIAYQKQYRETHKVKQKEYQKGYQTANESFRIKKKLYRLKNKERIAFMNKAWKLKNPDKVKVTKRKQYELNKTKIREYQKAYNKKRRSFDTLFRLKANIRTLISNSFRKTLLGKKSTTNQIIGCSFDEFKSYLEAKFEPWMNWNNYGKYNGAPNYGWDIDHLISLSTAKTEDDIIRLNHYLNLQPLCSYINRVIKST